MITPILAALFPQWRDRDERLCREIVARGICAPTSDLGIAVRATLARVDALRGQRDDMWTKWGESHAGLRALSAKAVDAARSTAFGAMARELGEVCSALGTTSPIRAAEIARALSAEAASLRGIHRDMLRVVGERDDARRELAALRESVRDVARRMAEQISEVSNG